MNQYSFKTIQTVPPLGDFLDIVLSRTQRKTPTVIHKGYAISRIRSFYMRKVKFTQETFDEKLGAILNDFPRLDDIHPFYADLMNILYDRDHYKLALAQMNTARHLIDTVGKEYVKLLKFGDSLYRCKQLKRAALGRMATIMRRQRDTLLYLEQVRQHLSRLPCIDPNTRTLLICGYPNVGKSSFMNKLTRADVDVQPYAFTTKSLFVGHMDFKYLRWQVIDTPGILDHPLEERNTIEMQSITALAHLRACVLFFVDVSESCGYSIAQQVSLFNSIRPLFVNKPMLLVASKIDLVRPEQIGEEDRALLQSLIDAGSEFAQSSCVTDEGVMDVRNRACEKLLAQRVEIKMKGQKINDILNRLHLSQPTPRDDRVRAPFIPDAVLQRRQPERRLARHVEEENGGAGVFNVDLKQNYLLLDDSWKHDAIPELWNGKNVADFVDADIEEKLLRLEEEEEALEKSGVYDETVEPLTAEQEVLLEKAMGARATKKMQVQEHRAKKRFNSRPVIPSRLGQRKRVSSASAMDIDGIQDVKRDRSVCGLRNDSEKTRVHRLKRISQRQSNLMAKRGEADRDVQVTKPRHLFSGKRKGGKTDRR